MTMELYTNESVVAERLGVSRETLRLLRKKEKGAAGLAEGPHWRRGGNNAVEYTQAGIAEAMRIVASAPPSDTQIAALAAPREHIELHVARIVTNKRLVLAVRAAADVRSPTATLLRVQVKNSKKMRPGMVLDRCRRLRDDLYVFEGRKPRRAIPLRPTQGSATEPEK